MQTERTRTEHLVWHFRQVPFQIMHMRQLAETTVGAQTVGAGKITGSKERTTLPYRVDPADDADLLWATLIIFAREVAERTGNPAPKAVRARMWQGRDEPQGLPVCTASEAFALATEVIRWLEACAHQIAHMGELNDSPDDLVRLIRNMRRAYPRSEPTFKAYRPRPCPLCQQTTIAPIYDQEGLAGYQCDTCEAQWDRDGAPVEQITLREGDSP